MKKLVKEFKEFAMRGNVLDMAVGVVVGGAFSKIVSSLVADIIMPLVGLVVGKIDFTKLSLQYGETKITYGNFLQNVIDFLVISFCIFCAIKLINKFKRKTEVKEEETPKLTVSEELLMEIRDLLKEKQN